MTTPTDVELHDLARAVGARLASHNVALVTAESCTGGWIAKACTDVAGSSNWFMGGVVAYSNALKSALLGVPDAVLAGQGAVSEPVVRAMAEGVLRRTHAGVSVAVSGVAGPGGGSVEKPVGTVWLAWAWRQTDGSFRMETRRVQLPGSREDIRRETVRCALERLLRE